jgi:HK97 family phage portal protein
VPDWIGMTQHLEKAREDMLAWFHETKSRHQAERQAQLSHQKAMGERVLASMLTGGVSYGFPGGWSQDRVEQATHFKHWSFVAIRAICEKIAGLTPNIAHVYADDGASLSQSANSGGSGHQNYRGLSRQLLEQTARRTDTHRLMRLRRYEKTNQAILPHEEIEPVGSDHPLVRLFKRPNAYDVGWSLWYELIMYLKLTGNSYLWVVPNAAGFPQELWVIPAHWVWARVGKGHLIDYYEIRPWLGPGTLKFPREEVIHFAMKNPLHKVDGWSPQQAGAEWIDASESVDRSRFFQFKNGCFPIGAVEFDKTFADPDEHDLERMYAKFFARLQGESNYGKPIIMPAGTKYNPLMIAPNEMAYVESAEQLRDWVLSLFGVPKEIVGLQPTGSDLSWYAPMLQFVVQTINPLLQYIGQSLTPAFAERMDDEYLRIWWDDPTPNNPVQINSDITTDIQARAISVNEVRGIRGREPWVGGDDPIAPSGESILPLATGQAMEDYLPSAEQIAADRAEQVGAANGQGNGQASGNGQANGQLNGGGNGQASANGNGHAGGLGRRMLPFAKCGGEGGEPGPCPEGGHGDHAGHGQPTLGDKPKNTASLHERAKATVKKWLGHAKKLGVKVMSKAKAAIKAKYQKLSERYGPKFATAIMAAGIAGLPVPLPGSSLLLAAPVIAAAEIYRLVHKDDEPDIDEVWKAAQEFWADTLGEWKDANAEPTLIDIPDIRQMENGSCGAAALRAVCQFYGIGPDTEEEFRGLLGTTNEKGTSVGAMVKVAEDLGLVVHAAEMEIDDLAQFTADGVPVICPIQAGDDEEKLDGHYIVVVGVGPKSVFVHDVAKGRRRIGKNLFNARWHDVDSDSKEYNKFGIALGKPADAAADKSLDGDSYQSNGHADTIGVSS